MGRRLGKGLSSLLGDPQGQDSGSEQRGGAGGPLEVPVARIRPNPFQPRKAMDPVGLEELRDSIREHGVLQPVVLRESGSGYELVAGERRWRAAQMAGLEKIPASLRHDLGDADMLELALVENVQRRDLDPMERARGFKALMEALSLTQRGVAAKVGLNRASVANHLRLLDLPDKAQEAMGKGLLTMGHARALLGLPEESAMLDLLSQIVRRDLSVRDVERYVRDWVARAQSGSGGGPEDHGKREAPWVSEMQRRMTEHLGTKVSLQDQGGKRGRIVIDYFTRADLDRLCELLAPKAEI